VSNWAPFSCLYSTIFSCQKFNDKDLKKNIARKYLSVLLFLRIVIDLQFDKEKKVMGHKKIHANIN